MIPPGCVLGFAPALFGPFAGLGDSAGDWDLPIEIGLLNNMPDAALLETERQFRALLTGGGRNSAVRLHPFALEEIPRSERARRHLAAGYGTLDDLKQSRLDALVITGAEPLTNRIEDEIHWHSLVEILDWAERNTVSTFVSCLAAQAAVLHFDGIARRPLARKCSGFFDHEICAGHPLMAGIGLPWRVAHSRWNALPEDALGAAGYGILSASRAVGSNLFIRQGHSLFVLAQGHPEYGPEALPKEYRRDVRRFLSGERDDYPSIPCGCFSAEAEDALNRFRERARRQRTVALMAEFPSVSLCKTDGCKTDGCKTDGCETNGGRRAPSARRLFDNWVRFVTAAKPRGRLGSA